MNTNANGKFYICTGLRASIKFTPVLLAALVAAGCVGHQKKPAVVQSITTSELDVIVALLKSQSRSSDRSPIPLVIMDTFSMAGLTVGSGTGEKFKQSLLSQASDKVPADLINDFCAKNAKPHSVPPDLGKRLEVVLCSEKELQKMFAAGPGVKPDGWDEFTPNIHNPRASSPFRESVSISEATWRWFTSGTKSTGSREMVGSASFTSKTVCGSK